MMYEKTIKQTFLDRLREHNMIVVSHQYGSAGYHEHKIIGVKNGLKWDFTPLISHLTECRTNGKDMECLALRGFMPSILKCALVKLSEEGFDVDQFMIDSPRDFYSVFFI